jgi:large repetitive protein
LAYSNATIVAENLLLNPPELDNESKEKIMGLLFNREKVNTADVAEDHLSIAKLTDGGYVILWESPDGVGPDSLVTNIKGQRFNSSGIPVGNEFRVNGRTYGDQHSAKVISLNDGGFLTLWASYLKDQSVWVTYGQRFDNNSVRVGPELEVNKSSNHSYSELTPNIKMPIAPLPRNEFVYVWESNDEVKAQRYSLSGAKIGAEIAVNTYTLGGQTSPAIAAKENGEFLIVWNSAQQDGSGWGVYGQRFAANGSKVGPEFRVNTNTNSDQVLPEVTFLAGGGFLVVWESSDGTGKGVYAQLFDAAGNAIDSEFRVNTVTAGNEFYPRIAALTDGGFAISWGGSGSTIHAQQYNAAGVKVDGELLVDTIGKKNPVIAPLEHNGFVVSWVDTYGGYSIAQRLVGNAVDFPRQSNPQLNDVVNIVTYLENAVNSLPQPIDADVSLTDSDSSNFDGGSIELSVITSYRRTLDDGLHDPLPQDRLGVRSQGQVSGDGLKVSVGGVEVGSIVSDGTNGKPLLIRLGANATVTAIEMVIENLTYTNTSSSPIASRLLSLRVMDGDGGASDAKTIKVDITPQTDGAIATGTEKVILNAFTGVKPSITGLEGGGYAAAVVGEVKTFVTPSVYQANNLVVQRYSANNSPLSPVVVVGEDSKTTNSAPHIIGTSDGGFFVVWSSRVVAFPVIYAQRFSGDGVAVGEKFKVGDITLDNETSLAQLSNGGFVVAWNSGSDIVFKRFSADGSAVGSLTAAHAPSHSLQGQPSVAGLAHGGFVVLWTDPNLDGNFEGIFGQRFATDGSAQGDVFQVNTYTLFRQTASRVAGLKDGGFVAVWTTSTSDKDYLGTSVVGQRFDANGVKIGQELKVNTSLANNQNLPDVAALDNGGWVVTWSDAAKTIAQQYDAAGDPVDGELQIGTYVSAIANSPVEVAALDDGFVVAYWSYPNKSGVGELGMAGVHIQRLIEPALTTFTGTRSNDTLIGSSGANVLNGLEGIDTAIFAGVRDNYTVVESGANWTVTDTNTTNGDAGTDTLINIERLLFSDKQLAIDLDGNAGTVVKILGAVFSKTSVANKQYVGIGLNLIDDGISYEALAGLALVAAKATTGEQIVNLLWTNLMGTAPTTSEAAPYIKMLSDGMLPGTLAKLAAETSFNAVNIDLVGLAHTGVEYILV